MVVEVAPAVQVVGPTPPKPLWERSLEDTAKIWAAEEADYRMSRLSMRNPPTYFNGLIFLLRERHRAISTVQACTCLVAHLGFERLRRWPEVKAVADARRSFLRGLSGSAAARRRAAQQVPFVYARPEWVSEIPVRQTVTVLENTARGIQDVANALGMSRDLVLKFSLFAGFGASEVWLPAENPLFPDVLKSEILGAREYLSDVSSARY